MNSICVSLAAFIVGAGLCSAATIYDAGVAPVCGGCVVGVHLVTPDLHNSVAGVGGGGLAKAAGSALDGARTYIYDLGAAADLVSGSVDRGVGTFAMMIWDMGTALDTMRLYTHQDHYGGGPITTDFVAQDVMEYSVWGSNDGDHFDLLSDPIAFAIAGGGFGLPTYTFAGTAPEIVFRGGSTEFGVLNAYTRDYVFAKAYRYYGVRTSTISLVAADADPEIDAVMGHRGSIVHPVPEPSFVLPLAGALIALWWRNRHPRTV